jgi:Fur family ferric uptake transcriptional regulator
MSRLANVHSPNEVREAFRTYLRDRGIKYTTARRNILDVVLEMHDHFEAEQVLYAFKVRGLRVGKATVYRTLPLLVDCGILKQVRFDVKQAHYEHAFGQGPHDHMLCRRCGRIVEFASSEVVELRSRIARQHHFHVIGHRLQLYGLCWECSIACPVATKSLAGPASKPQPPPQREGESD